MNFSRKPANTPMRVGCQSNSAWLDLSGMIADKVVDFPGVPHRIEDVLAVSSGLESIESQVTALTETGNLEKYRFDETEVMLHAPILRPQKLIGIGLNYSDHAAESNVAVPKTPLLFGMYSNAIIGPGASIVLSPATSQVDYEAELAIVIGSRARNVSPENAVGHVAGYTIVHDVSARDLQFGEKQWLRGKSIDTFAPMGPYLVTRRALRDADGLAIQLVLNGKVMQQSNTSNLIFKVPALISHISQTMTLEPGDVIATGTPAGVGYVRKPPVFLKAGDVVEISIEGIGVLKNNVTGP
jgi:2-keto-4-pentenoate hydratase/2-oxohepta-3-ene-1,7-dioic acid hydratase in catechol pathway